MRRFLVPLLTCALLVALAPAALAAPAPAAAPVRYVALGDSYAAGVGARPDPATGDCRRSDASYPALWAARHAPASFVSVACSGATSGEVIARQVRTVSADTTLVTITVGGNDTGFGPVLAACSVARDDETCLRAVRGGERAARWVAPGGLISTIVGVRLQAPDATILVLGYPRLFEPGADCDVPGVPNAVRREALNRAADTLDAALADAAGRFRGRFVDVRGAFAGHGICSADPWITPPPAAAPAVYHPTGQGYRDGYLPAFEAALHRP
ncbi:SGNH/GDSL hydrolase family protein [Pseudonocardia sp. ICBG1293]|uniref:SGNH/GDSL hydrolase family protein n=1 Tax=Pseudonocardia sp. ICBG1293 TaxID=2844382 RepID=UPI001CCD38FC|nr:SGNH/GDSL hydrolase family protein [Pseudonocardia sp. ICBG1293]